MKRRILYFLFAGLTYLTCNPALFAQPDRSHPDRLPWVDGVFPAKRGAFDYRVARGEGITLSNARDDAFNGLLADLGNQAGVTVNSQTLAQIKSELNYQTGSESYRERTSHVTTHQIDREGFKASFTKVSEYYEYAHGRYLLWELYAVSSGAAFTALIPEYTTHYGAAAVWRSLVLPGWGQFHKKKVVKGAMILTAEVATVSGALFCEIRRSDNWRKSAETTHVNIIKEYRNRADSWGLRRNLFLGAAAGVYLWNLLDAAMAKGKLKYAWLPDHLNFAASEANGSYYCGVSFHF